MRSEMPDENTPGDQRVRGLRFGGTLLIGTSDRIRPPISIAIIYEPVEAGWVQARIEGVPEVITTGQTKDEARELVIDALREYLLSIRANGDAVDRELLHLQSSH